MVEYSNIVCSKCGKRLKLGEPQIVVDYGETIKDGINFRDRIWEGHIECFKKIDPASLVEEYKSL